MIKKCKCDHEFQDARYGHRMRVHNKKAGKDARSPQVYVCTVCGREQ